METHAAMGGVHKTVNSHSSFGLLWLFLFFMLFFGNMEPNRSINLNFYITT